MDISSKQISSYHVVTPVVKPDKDLLVDTDVVDEVPNYEKFGKIYMLGETEKPFGLKRTELPQNYLNLRQFHLQNDTLFCDDNFSLDKSTLPDLSISGEVVWNRPSDIIDNPQFIVEGSTRFDVNQIGDCWFLPAMANLTRNQELFSMVVPPDQSFEQDYVGIFHFRFWQYGKWVDVVIDDRLPTINGKLIYLRSTNQREFWPSLFEKAYAKLYGSYKNIEFGAAQEASEDFCGALSEALLPSFEKLFEVMEMSHERSSFISCGIISQDPNEERRKGIAVNHAYSVTDFKKFKLDESDDITLIRIRNPWSNITEWKGDWSDKSKCWNLIPNELQHELLTQKSDGEFWMETADFKKLFTYVEFCHLNPTSFSQLRADKKKWTVNMFEGKWVPGVTAGGGPKNRETFASNPQYHLTIRGSDPDKKYALVISLLQTNRRNMGRKELPLEINIYRVNRDAEHLLDGSYFKLLTPVVNKCKHSLRQLTVRVMLPVGRYCLVPCTEEPNIYANYLLRIYSEINANVMETDDEIGYSASAILNQTEHRVHDPEHKLLFNLASADKEEIGWEGVKKALNKHFGNPKVFGLLKHKLLFSDDVCKTIVAFWDASYSGKLDFDEFEQLLRDVDALREVFRSFEEDNCEKVDGFEVRHLLRRCGYQVNRELLNVMMSRYGCNGYIDFENFVLYVFKLKVMIDEFYKRKTIDTSDKISININDWMKTILHS